MTKKLKSKVRRNPVRYHRRRRHDYTTTERLFTLIQDKIYKIQHSSKTFKEFRIKLSQIVDDKEFWKGLEDIGKLAKKLKLTMDNM